MENLLYYPYINMPKTNWTVRSLLYYDQIGSIVPMDYFYDPNKYDPFMRELVQKELVIPISPMEQFKKPWQICKQFTDYMNTEEFNLKQRKKSFKKKGGQKIFESKFQGIRIHTNKFDHELLYQIEQAGLAIREDNHEWFWVEKKTAGELMMFLASVLGKKIDFLPATDQKIKSNPFFLTKKRLEKTKEKREIILESLIPFPEEIDLTKLIKFKEQNSELLKRFKNSVELIALNSDIEVGSDLFREKIKELEFGKDEISIKMNENKMGKIFFGTFCGISGAVIGLAAAGTTGAIIGGLPSFANAIYSALQIEQIKDVDNNKGMKYIALVDKEIRKPTTPLILRNVSL
ncbi:hypothetical protein [Flavobacterium sp. ABG]|uniref:hypothetical protein n=1 Tax=Flavobacterium sp. ABG TaxID=1423322 RepID=UPI00064A1B1C|nr:hypothetical protein [Flavobacterium sp. ABG]KLT70219.1 hypothetical protein AB674_08380 [Flavobacterium sp. ABG]